MLIRLKAHYTKAGALLVEDHIPTGGLLTEDPIGETIIVNVPAEDFPQGLPEELRGGMVATRHGDVITSMTKHQLDAWHKHLDGRYAEHAGQFKPKCV